MKMAKPSQQDIDAAGDLMSILGDIDKGYYPERGAKEGAPTWFDEEDPEHLRAFFDAVKATLERGPGFPGRVIGGMCYVIMWDKNEIVDPAVDVIELHPRLVRALNVEAELSNRVEQARIAAYHDAARIARQFAADRPMVHERPTPIMRGRFEGEQNACSNVARQLLSRAQSGGAGAHALVKPIRTPSDHSDALAEVLALIQSDPKPGTPDADRLSVLAVLVEDYEKVRFPHLAGPVSALKPVEHDSEGRHHD